MKKIFSLLLLLSLSIVGLYAQVTLEYESKLTDMIQMKCFRLSNGMHVYVHENHDTPRILTNVVVRAGSMQDPADCTGLAHYMEHLFFNGTTQIGTLDYASEKPLLDEIEELFEKYRSTTDEAERKELYSRIDKLSFEASKYSVMNEYQDVLIGIGATDVNAFTGDKNTSFVSSIPSNEIERWAKLQSHMFSDFVIRGFHTELETVYEECNSGMHEDMGDVYQANDMMVFPEVYNHVKVIGKQRDLKNPSIREVYNFYRKYYVPENMAVCMSGDFDIDETLPILERTFGQIKASGSAPEYPEIGDITPGTQGYKMDVVGPQVPNVVMSWRLPKPTDERSQSIMRYVRDLLCHSGIGIIHNEYEVNNLIVEAEAEYSTYRDFSYFSLMLTPNADDLVEYPVLYAMQAIDSLAYDDWDESLLDGIRKDVKRSWLGLSKDNETIVACFADDFTNCRKWSSVEEDDALFADITKQEIQEFVKKWLCDDNLRVVYKRQGENTDMEFFSKPEITPLYDNNGKKSSLAKELLETPSKAIAPEYFDFAKEIKQYTLPDGNRLLYLQNTEDDLYTLMTYNEVSTKDIRLLQNHTSVLALSSDEEPIQVRRFRLGYDAIPMQQENGYCVSGIRGLNETFAEAIASSKQWGGNTDSISMDAYREMYEQLLAFRELGALERDYQRAVLYNNVVYGKKNRVTNMLTLDDFKKHTPMDFYNAYRSLNDYSHTIGYYGPASADSVIAILSEYHKPGAKPKVSSESGFVPQKVKKSEVMVKPFSGDNTSLFLYSCNGNEYKWEEDYLYNMFNAYIGSDDLGGPLLSEMRGKRSLCYSVSLEISEEVIPGTPYYILGAVDCQSDKLVEAIKTFQFVIDEMPLSRERFEKVKEARLNELKTVRYHREDALTMYWAMLRFNFMENPEKYEYERLQAMTFEDFEAFYEKNIRNRKYRYMILGNITDEQRAFLKTLGKVTEEK